ncbi:MAG: peptidase S8/S53 subtilisin kexin sedolisin, partial [Candidatus Daviesbacteria bacterium GW2011_GWC1_40_9]
TWATDNGAKVVNMSLGGSVKSSTLEKAVNYAWDHQVVVVAAAGNSANPSKTYPAAYTNAIAVAATNNKDQKASFSSYGAKWVDVAAPGVDIFSTFPNHPYKINKSLGYDFGSGTSMATPMTSAVAALIWSTPYGTSASQVRTRLEGTADKIPGTGMYWSSGRVNAANAVLLLP